MNVQHAWERKKTLVVTSEGKRPFGVLGTNGLLVPILILNGVDDVGMGWTCGACG